MEIYNGSLLDKDRAQYFKKTDWLKQINLARVFMVNTKAVGMSEATWTQEVFNATVKEACDTFEMDKCHEEHQNL